MVALPQNNKSFNCPGILLERKEKILHGYLIYKSFLSFISSSYITEASTNDSPEEGTVTNEITPSLLMGHAVSCVAIWHDQTWCVTAVQSRLQEEDADCDPPPRNKLVHKIADNKGCFWSYITDKSLFPGSSSSVQTLFCQAFKMHSNITQNYLQYII